MIKLSIIIPTLNATDALGACMTHIGTGGEMVVEVIVSDGGSSDQTGAVAFDYGANVVLGPPGRGAQLARGARKASGDWLLFLHADCHLPHDWPAVLSQHVQTRPDRAAAFRLRFRAAGAAPRLVAAWANLRSHLGLPYGDQALFISAPLYARIGGYAALPLMEDVDIARRLKGKIRLLPATITTSAQKYQAEGWLRRGAKNLNLLARYMLGADPKVLAKSYSAPPDLSDEN